MRWYRYLTWVSCYSTHFNRGNPTLSPGIQHGGRASHWGWSPVYRSSAEVQAWLSSKYMTTLRKERLKQTSNKRVRPREIQEKDFVPKKRYYLSNRTPRASGRLAMKAHVRWLLQLWTVANLHVQWKPMQSRNTLSKNTKLDKSQIWKGGLGKNERLGGLKTQKGGPGKN